STSIQLPFPRGQKPRSSGQTLGDIDGWLRGAMKTGGYNAPRYWAVRDGFAVATGIEQITDDGSPDKTNRWSTTVNPPHIFSLRSYLSALFSAHKGLYRLIVFVVSPHLFAPRATPLRFQPSIDWLWTGLLSLPKSLAARPLDDDVTCTALVYE